MTNSSNRRPIFGAAVAVFVVAADQWSKAVVIHPFGGRATGAILPIRNAGLLSGVAAGGRLAVGTVAVAVVIGFGAVIINRVRHGRLAAWTAGLLLGGAVANLVDRIALGSVRDFLVVGRLVVNLADIAILIGIAAYTWCAVVARFAKTSPSM